MIAAFGFLARRKYCDGIPVCDSGVHTKHGNAVAAELIGKIQHFLGVGLEFNCLVEIFDCKRTIDARSRTFASHGAFSFRGTSDAVPHSSMPSRLAAASTEASFGVRNPASVDTTALTGIL
jgi:hypothetical protein